MGTKDLMSIMNNYITSFRSMKVPSVTLSDSLVSVSPMDPPTGKLLYMDYFDSFDNESHEYIEPNFDEYINKVINGNI